MKIPKPQILSDWGKDINLYHTNTWKLNRSKGISFEQTDPQQSLVGKLSQMEQFQLHVKLNVITIKNVSAKYQGNS